MRIINCQQLSALLIGILFAAGAQSQSRPPGWEFRADVLYQNQKRAYTEGGSDVKLDTNWGGSLGMTYRFNPYAELSLLLDLQSINYDAKVVRADVPNTSVNVSDKVDIYTPRVVGNFNFIDYPLTPYVSAGMGWSFVDSNVPNGQAEVGCWWDPWFGYICAPYQTTYHNDAFEYDIGAGLRWDISKNFGMRFAYEKHWVSLSGAAGTPNLDQFRIGVQFGY